MFIQLPPVSSTPKETAYDVIIVGGATMGACTAWFLASNPDFQGKKVLIVEQAVSFATAQTKASNNCMRQQFANPINIKMGQFAAEFVKNFGTYLRNPEAPSSIPIQNFGYLYLSNSPELTQVLQRDQQVQADCGASTQMVKREYLAHH